MKKIYLAIPYSQMPEKSFYIANKISAIFMEKGFIVFSPISHSHPISMEMKRYQTNYHFWLSQDRVWFEYCEMLVVLMLPGWKESKGVQIEIGWARELKMPIVYI